MTNSTYQTHKTNNLIILIVIHKIMIPDIWIYCLIKHIYILIIHNIHLIKKLMVVTKICDTLKRPCCSCLTLYVSHHVSVGTVSGSCDLKRFDSLDLPSETQELQLICKRKRWMRVWTELNWKIFINCFGLLLSW